jgi:hypothetical protein
VLRAVLLVALGLAAMAAATWASGRDALRLGAAAVLAGALVALVAVLLIDCRQCHTSALAVGGFASMPFFAVGLVLLAVVPGAVPWRGALVAAALVQLAWALPMAWSAIVAGQCPCGALPWSDGPGSGLAAIGIDRWMPVLFVVEALALLGVTVRRN